MQRQDLRESCSAATITARYSLLEAGDSSCALAKLIDTWCYLQCNTENSLIWRLCGVHVGIADD